LIEDLTRPTRINFEFDASPWQSLVTFEPGVLVDVTGTNLRLNFELGLDPTSLFGTTFQLFDWTTVTPTGQFDLSNYSEYNWDLSRLYTNGQVTLVGIPEPSALVIVLVGYVVWGRKR
jgi:hypothetical protein